MPLDPDVNWSLNIDPIAAAIRPNTKLVTMNSPPIQPAPSCRSSVMKPWLSCVAQHRLYILHDEIFNGLGETSARHLPFIADIDERGRSLNVMSKSCGLSGLRIG